MILEKELIRKGDALFLKFMSFNAFFMNIKQKNIILENVVGTKISVELLGTSELTAEQELEQLHNFTRNLEYTKIKFSAPMKMIDNIPVIASEDDSDTQLVSLNLINKKIPLDETFSVDISIDVSKIPTSELGDVFTTVESLAQAKIVLFAAKIKEEINRLLTEIRAMSNDFETEIEYTL